MLSLMKRKRCEVSCYNCLRSTSEGLDVLLDFLVEGKSLELHLTLTDDEGRIDIRVGSRANYEDLKIIAGFLFEGNPLEIYLAQREEEGQKLYFSLSAVIMKGFGNCNVFGFYHFPRDCSASYSAYDMLQRVRPLRGSDCEQGFVLLLGEHLACCGIKFSGRTGLCRLLRREGYQRQLPNARNASESMWPSIPAFLLWMIKDKLHTVDDVHLSAVCRDWWLASASYPRKQSLGNGVPFLMHAQIGKKRRRNAQTCKKIARSNAKDFICVATKKKYTLQLPEFRRSFILYSKQGWFLMKQKYSKSAKELGVFLINPIKKAKIKLPSVDPIRYMDFGSFSTQEGYPHCVVLLVRNNAGPIAIKTAYPGDEMWSNHTYTGGSFQRREFCKLINIREHVYCYNRGGAMLVYNMDTQVWKEAPALPQSPEEYTYRYMTEFEGHVVEVHRRDNSCEFSFFKYNETKTAWEKLNGDDVKDTSWFLADWFQYMGRFSFCTREKGLKLYYVCSKFNEDDFVRGLEEQQIRRPYRHLIERQRYLVNCSGFQVVCYDLMDGSRESVSLPYRVSPLSMWVDI